MTTKYVPVRPRRRRARGRRVVAGVLIGAAAFAGIGALGSIHAPHHHAAVVVHEQHTAPPAPAATPKPHAHKSHHVLRNAMLLHRLVHVPYALRPHPFRRMFWRPRFSLFRRTG